jgi:formate-dependent nitrite reductase membrane component NrfD
LSTSFIWIGETIGILLGLAVLAIGALLLLLHLGHPKKFWRAFSMFHISWISRGTVLITIFFIVALLYLYQITFSNTSPSHSIMKTLAVTLSLTAFFILLYPGLFLSRSPSIPFWNSALLPVIFLLQGLTSGFSIVLLYFTNQMIAPLSINLVSFLWVQFGGLALLFIMTFLYLSVMFHSGAAAKESAHMLVRGELSRMFLFWGVFIGIMMPAVLMYVVICESGYEALLTLVCVFSKLIGDVLFRYFIIKAGIYENIF